MSSRKPIDAAQVRHLYQAEGLSLAQIAARLACSPSTVRRRLAELHVPVRPRGPAPRSPARARQGEWSPELAYALGVIATDGNLSQDGRHLTVVSADPELLETVRACLGLSVRITTYVRSPSIYRLQWGDRAFFDWALGIGLMPAKSLRLGPLSIPDPYFRDFFRGCIDGDGSIIVYVDRYNTYKDARYVFQRLVTSLASASLPFLEWIHATILRLVDVRGHINQRADKPGRAPLWTLRFSKRASIQLLGWMYYAPEVPCLERKRNKALTFIENRPSHSG